jgi:hypothetical protein
VVKLLIHLSIAEPEPLRFPCLGRSYDRRVRLRWTRRGWEEPRPDACSQGHTLRGSQVLVGSLHCDCGAVATGCPLAG